MVNLFIPLQNESIPSEIPEQHSMFYQSLDFCVLNSNIYAKNYIE